MYLCFSSVTWSRKCRFLWGLNGSVSEMYLEECLALHKCLINVLLLLSENHWHKERGSASPPVLPHKTSQWADGTCNSSYCEWTPFDVWNVKAIKILFRTMCKSLLFFLMILKYLHVACHPVWIQEFQQWNPNFLFLLLKQNYCNGMLNQGCLPKPYILEILVMLSNDLERHREQMSSKKRSHIIVLSCPQNTKVKILFLPNIPKIMTYTW